MSLAWGGEVSGAPDGRKVPGPTNLSSPISCMARTQALTMFSEDAWAEKDKEFEPDDLDRADLRNTGFR